jgi:hypothetical protein
MMARTVEWRLKLFEERSVGVACQGNIAIRVANAATAEVPPKGDGEVYLHTDSTGVNVGLAKQFGTH